MLRPLTQRAQVLVREGGRWQEHTQLVRALQQHRSPARRIVGLTAQHRAPSHATARTLRTCVPRYMGAPGVWPGSAHADVHARPCEPHHPRAQVLASCSEDKVVHVWQQQGTC